MRPNILFIMADQFRADALGCVGGYTRTPNLDSLARDGWLFANAYANSAECIPSRISLATGLYPHQTGVDRNIQCTLNPDQPLDAGHCVGPFRCLAPNLGKIGSLPARTTHIRCQAPFFS